MSDSDEIVHLRLRTTDVDEVRAAVSALNGEARLIGAEVPWRFSWEHDIYVGSRIVFSHVKCTGATYGGTEEEPGAVDLVNIVVVLGGELRVQERDGTWLDTSRPLLFRTGDTRRILQADMELLVVALHADALLERARARDPALTTLSFGAREPSSAAAIALWRALIEHVRSLADEGFQNLRMRDNIYAALADAALDLFPPQREKEPAVQPTPLITRAQEYVDDNLARPIAAAELAQAVGVDERRLRDEFVWHLGMTPAAYIRDLRFEAARVDLIAADAVRETVANVARRWGFASVSSFSDQYHRRYGEPPGATLGR